MSAYQSHGPNLSEITETIGHAFKSRNSSFPFASNWSNPLPSTNLVGCILKSYSWVFAIHLALISKPTCCLSIYLNDECKTYAIIFEYPMNTLKCFNDVTSAYTCFSILWYFSSITKWFAHEHNGLFFVLIILLREESCNSVTGSERKNFKWLRLVWTYKCWCSGNSFFNIFKFFPGFFIPLEIYILF